MYNLHSESILNIQLEISFLIFQGFGTFVTNKLHHLISYNKFYFFFSVVFS